MPSLPHVYITVILFRLDFIGEVGFFLKDPGQNVITKRLTAPRHLHCLSNSFSLQVRAPRSTVQLLSEIPKSGLKSRGDWAFFSSGPLICGSVYLDQIETLLKIHFFSLAFNPGLARDLGLQAQFTWFYLMMFLLFILAYVIFVHLVQHFGQLRSF